ncbi:hypothetical protein [Apibacter sp. HY039]|uniref:hypothetical protein n=1 Tax=Apibacter sp. HY039 TaxID=2501476 RepID=UPI000FEBB98C|nr:hypothetical protein [Apibacter sp. HY039]
MFLGLRLFIFFIIALPLSYIIGMCLAFLTLIYFNEKKLKLNVKQILISGGIMYIVAQPISFILIIILQIEKLNKIFGFSPVDDGLNICETLFAVLFAIVFTCSIISLRLHHKHKKFYLS